MKCHSISSGSYNHPTITKINNFQQNPPQKKPKKTEAIHNFHHLEPLKKPPKKKKKSYKNKRLIHWGTKLRDYSFIPIHITEIVNNKRERKEKKRKET